jgi:hypothetical protein
MSLEERGFSGRFDAFSKKLVELIQKEDLAQLPGDGNTWDLYART